ncbi:MAG: GntR family transcriptional regulator, partial [Chloroflexi bacterium]|nr:GntR family transcriptional regulator [Chloroflexota bacterium]
HLGVNRMTLRRALRALEGQGLLLRRHGVGTYVAQPKIVRPMDAVFRFATEMQSRGYTPGTRLVSVEHTALDAARGRELDAPPGSPAYRILRLRSINREPVLLESYTLLAARFPGLERHDLEGRSIYETFESEYGVKIVRARQSFEPVTASQFEAELLQVRAGAPLMLERRISYDDENRPVEYGKDRYRGDRFRFGAEAAPYQLAARAADFKV